MPASDSPAVIVARFLRANHYDSTLDAFIHEAGLPIDAGSLQKGDLTIEKILEEKKVFDLSLRFEKSDINERDKSWSATVPSMPSLVSTLPASSNVLHVSIEAFTDSLSQNRRQLLLVTTADRRFNAIKPDADFELHESRSDLQDSPILSCASMSKKDLITISCGMSGQIVVFDHQANKICDERRDHKKYVVKVATWIDGDDVWIATAGWDGRVFTYRTGNEQKYVLGEPVASITIHTNPETVLFLEQPDSKLPLLLVTRRDSTHLYFYGLPSLEAVRDPGSATGITHATPQELELLGKQNLAPHSNAWIAFSPSSVAVCPTDPSLLAIATSAVPHMKLIIVRVLWPSTDFPVREVPEEARTQATQMRANLALQDKESMAIRTHVSTLAPQTPYSTPNVAWRPDGSGVWVNGDDGVLRGVEAKTGKVVHLLKDGHEAGSKIRSIWCGMVDTDSGTQEWLVSGGFDHRLIVWKPEK